MDHTVTAFEDELRAITSDVERLGRMAVSQLRGALDVVAGRAGAEAAQALMAEDKRLNAAAFDIERKAVRLIALRHPMADDLRQTVVALKCALDLERCGDLAKNIAKRTLRMNAPTPEAFVPLLEQLGALAVDALERVLQAHAEHDLDSARAVWVDDDAIDEVHERLVRELLGRMGEDAGMAAAGAQLLFIAKNLERIGDHATNIAEMVCYEATGSSDVRGDLSAR
jgi:phosphate transport system protein